MAVAVAAVTMQEPQSDEFFSRGHGLTVLLRISMRVASDAHHHPNG